jgi:hypothetical protein
MVKPEELEALLLVARKYGVKRMSVPVRSPSSAAGGVLEVELEPQLVPLVLARPATSAPVEPDTEEQDPLFDAVEA